ncbi:MAG: hypothetical protein PF482_14460 [Desulfobacteraceae bacterium]|jgi:hypothetical protein|nr:hypothetical protein [Desulfobacteraceae bacterium]
MKLLLDFVNTKKWNIDTLTAFFKKYGFVISMAGYNQGYELQFITRAFPENIFRLESDDHSINGIIIPGDDRFNDFFEYLQTIIRDVWIERLMDTKERGPDISLMNEIAKRARFEISEGKKPFLVEVGNYYHDGMMFEEFLEAEYLKIFMTGQGDRFKKLRICRKPDCGKWFIYNRPKQNFCSDKCRLDFHNAIYKEDGRAAAHQRKGRSEKPDIYLK